MSGVDNLTVLQADGKILAKTWCKDGTIKPYGGALQYLQKPQKVRGIGELSKLLTKLESKSQMCIIRGQYSGEDPAAKVLRRKAVFKDQLLHTILIEVDNFEPITADPVIEPQAGIDEFITTLPNAFHGASYHWQLSSSAGHPTKLGLRAHVWFWLSEPRTSAELRAWAKAANVPCDHAVFDAVQVHYTSSPVFEPGVIDPVPVRSGFVQGTRDQVDLTIDPTIFEKAATVASASSGKPHHFSLDDVREMLHHVEGNVDRESWLHTLWALRRTWRASEGRLDEHAVLELADQWSARGDPKGYEGSSDVEAHWLEGDDCDDGYNVGSLVNWARAGGWQPTSEQNERLVGSSAASPEEFDIIADPVDVPPALDRFRLIPLCELEDLPPPSWLIKGILPQVGLAMIYGEPGSGKSFLAWDMACALVRGVSWRERRTKQIRVAWLAAEAVDSIGIRSRAYKQQNGLSRAAFDIPVMATAPDLRDRKQIDQIIAKLKGAGFGLLVIDTMAASIGSADENTPKDMNPVMQNCLRIRAETGCMVLLIHHSGKDLSRGSRGTNSIKGAQDAELEVSRNGDNRAVRITKNRYGPEGEEFGFKLLPVLLGYDEHGDEISSCVVEPAEIVASRPTSKAKGVNQKAVFEAAMDLMAIDGSGAPEVEVIKAAAGRIVLEPGKRDRRERNATQALQALCDNGIFQRVDGRISFVN